MFVQPPIRQYFIFLNIHINPKTRFLGYSNRPLHVTQKAFSIYGILIFSQIKKFKVQAGVIKRRHIDFREALDFNECVTKGGHPGLGNISQMEISKFRISSQRLLLMQNWNRS